MNPDQPSREDIEVKITALLLGELPAEEARLLRWTIAQDPAWQQLHDRLQLTIGLVREVVAKTPDTAAAPETVKAEGLKLSESRRGQLLAQLEKPSPQPLFWLKRIEVPRLPALLLPALAVMAIIGLVVVIALPNFVKARSTSQSNVIINNLRALDAAKQQWALEKHQSAEATPTMEDLRPYLTKTGGQAVGGEKYILGKVSESPVADLSASQVRKLAFGGQSHQLRLDSDGARDGYATTAVATPAPPSEVTVPSAPIVAPPPTRIVLPSTEPAAGAVAASGSLNNQEHTWEASILSPDRTVATPVADGLPTAMPPSSLAESSPQTFASGLVLPPTTSFGEAAPIATFGSGAKNATVYKLGGGGGGGGGETATLGIEARDAGPIGSKDEVRQMPEGRLNANGILDFHMPAKKTQTREKSETAPASGQRLAASAAVAGQVYRPGTSGITLNGISEVSSAQPRLLRKVSAKAKLPATTQSEKEAQQAGVNVTPAPASTPVPSPGSATGEINAIATAGNLQDKPMPSFVFDLPQPNSTTGITGTHGDKLVAQNAPAGVYGFNRRITDQAPAEAPVPVIMGTASSESDPDYQAAKNKLVQMQDRHKLLYSKIEQTKMDIVMPSASIVQIIEPAEPGKSETFMQKMTGTVESKARIRVENESSDIASLNGSPAASAMTYDAYYLQTTFEIIKSDAVLGKVVDDLKLDQAWAKRDGLKLDKKTAIALLKKRIQLQPVSNTKVIEIGATSDRPEEAAKIANAVADAYRKYRVSTGIQFAKNGMNSLNEEFNREDQQIQLQEEKVAQLGKKLKIESAKAAQPVEKDYVTPRPPADAPVPQPEMLTRENAFSTFSLNVSDVSFKLAAASLEKGQLPEPASIRSEEFINAFDYRDPEAAAGEPIAFAAERARYPFAQNRDLLRFSVKTAAAGRPDGRALNLVLLLDNSGSMERADRVAIIRAALAVLTTQLQPQDTVSVVTFARTARLWLDGASGTEAGAALEKIGELTPQGGTNLEEALRLAYETARRHYHAGGLNRVVMLTDGAANLGNVDAGALTEKVEANRQQGIALDCFGIGWEGLNDDLLEQLTRHGDGRYAFINTPAEATQDFAAKLAGALQIAAADVKVQVEFNPERVISYRQIGYAKHQLTKEQFRDNTVDAAEIAAQEAGNALYTVETKPDGRGPVATVRLRYKVPGTTDYRERSWVVPYAGTAVALAQASPALRLAATASAFSEWLAASPFAQEISPAELTPFMAGVPEFYGADARPKQLVLMLLQAKSLAGK